jgi:hypothetical protein
MQGDGKVERRNLLGNPNTGEIYEGALRDPGDVPLTEAQAEMLRSLPVRDRMTELATLREQITGKIVESAAELKKPQTPEPPEFIRLVMQQVDAMKIKPRCQCCNVIGWANFTLHHAPVITPTVVQGEVILSACFICLKCGAETRRNLNVLGLTVTQEQRRVITPDQIQQKQPLIVTG